MKRQSGFTIIEIAIVLIVVGLLLGGVLKTVSVQRQQVKRDETRQQLDVIKDALIGFAVTNGRLPCPDTGVDGLSDPANPADGTPCTSNEGWLPHVDIGIGNTDAWGGRFRYRVTGSGANSFADAPPGGANASFTMADTGNITVRDEALNSIATSIPAIVISYAENARSTPVNCAGGLSARELENCDGDTDFISSFYSNVAGQTFDDLIVWIPLTVLKTKMIEASLLP